MQSGEVDIRPGMAERARKVGGGTAEVPCVALQTLSAREGNVSDNTPTLIEKVVCRENLMVAYRRVVGNGGAAGVDGMTVHELMAYCREHWDRIREELLSGAYMPEAVWKVEIPKPNGKGKRMLGIPTVLDRLIQQSLLQVLTPLFEPHFSPSSYGFRPRRSAHDAVLKAREFMTNGRRWVVDIDLENFFNHVNHDVLMARVARRIKDKTVLLLIRRYLQAGEPPYTEPYVRWCERKGTHSAGCR